VHKRSRTFAHIGVVALWACGFALAAAAPALAASNFTWTGEGLPGSGWSDGANWVGGNAPSGSVGTLAFPELSGSGCTFNPPLGVCHTSENNIAGLAVNALSIEGPGSGIYAYVIKGEAIALGSGGITVLPQATNGTNAGLALPITLTAPQTWSLVGNASQRSTLAVENSVTGASDALAIDFEGGAYLDVEPDTEVDVGDVRITGADSAHTGRQAYLNGDVFVQGEINSGSLNPISVTDAAFSLGGGAAAGPITSHGGQVSVSAFGTARVAGLELDPSSALDLYIEQIGSTVHSSELLTPGAVNLGGATLSLAGEGCPAVAGYVDTLISASGPVLGTFAGIPDGGEIEIIGCPDHTAKARIDYTEHTVTATILVGPEGAPGPEGTGGGPGGGNPGGTGVSSGTGGGAPRISSVSSPYGATSWPGAPTSGYTTFTIRGSGFVAGATRIVVAIPGEPEAQVSVRSPTELLALVPSVSPLYAGAQLLRVATTSGNACAPLTGGCYWKFNYFIPQIGTIVFRDRNWRAKKDPNAGEFDYCTGAVVNSRNGDVIVAAGHCVTTGTTWHEEVVFAPGYYGPFSGKCAINHHSYEALCGTSPYGWWQARLLDANEAYRNDPPPFVDQQGNDYGVIAVASRGNEHVQQSVGGGLPIAFCQGSGGFFGHHDCNASYGSGEHEWVAYGEPNPAVGPVHCGPGLTISSFYQTNKDGPENLKMEPCTALTNGSSGGPWISSAGTVGAVNQGLLGDTVAGTYLGEGALKAFEAAQGGSYSQAISLTSQNVRVDSAGVASIAVTCPGPSRCRGTASLSSQASAAIASVKHAKQTVSLGHARFAIHAGHSATIRIRVSGRMRSVLKRSHRALLATLTLRVAHAGVIKLPVTLSR
jgi:hypothetical protein